MNKETLIKCYCGNKISIEKGSLLQHKVPSENKVILTCIYCKKILSR
jgi:hypothetical protein